MKAIKLFCEMSDIQIQWKKITRGFPKVRRYADDRAPTLEEITKIMEYPDRRIKAIIYTMISSGIRLGAWDYLRWGDILPLKKDSKIIAARLKIYAGDNEEYFTFVTPEAYLELEKWMKYREQCWRNYKRKELAYEEPMEYEERLHSRSYNCSKETEIKWHKEIG